MFKKLFLALLIVGLLAETVLAGSGTREVLDTTIDFVGDQIATSDTMYVQDNKLTSFFVDYDETVTDHDVDATITLQVSYDRSAWLSDGFYDINGGATIQTSETLSADTWYYFWTDAGRVSPYRRVLVTGRSCDTNDTITVNAYEIWNK